MWATAVAARTTTQQPPSARLARFGSGGFWKWKIIHNFLILKFQFQRQIQHFYSLATHKNVNYTKSLPFVNFKSCLRTFLLKFIFATKLCSRALVSLARSFLRLLSFASLFHRRVPRVPACVHHKQSENLCILRVKFNRQNDMSDGCLWRGERTRCIWDTNKIFYS